MFSLFPFPSQLNVKFLRKGLCTPRWLNLDIQNEVAGHLTNIHEVFSWLGIDECNHFVPFSDTAKISYLSDYAFYSKYF